MNSLIHRFRYSAGLPALITLLFLAFVSSSLASGGEQDARLIWRFAGSLFFMAGTGMVSLAVGMSILRVRQMSALTVSFAFLAGYGLWGLLVFFTGVVHGLYRFVLVSELLIAGFFFRHRLNGIPTVLCRMVAELKSAPMILRAIVGGIAAYLCFLLIVSLAPVNTWDAIQSHWSIARHFARHHAVLFPFFDGNGGTPQLIRMIYSTFCVFGFDHQASLAVWLLFVSMIGLVFGVARQFTTSGLSLALTLAMFVLLVYRPWFSIEPSLDFPVLVFGLGAVICALSPIFRAEKNGLAEPITGIAFSRLFLLSGLLTGYAVGTKWHAATLYVMVPVILFILWRTIRPDPFRLKTIGLWVILACLPVIVFAVYDLVCTGNPFWHPMVPPLLDADYWSGVSSNLLLWREHVDYVRDHMYPSPLYAPIATLSHLIRSHVLILVGLFFVPFAFFTARRDLRKVVWLIFGCGFLGIVVPGSVLSTSPRNVLLGMGTLLLLVPVGCDYLVRRYPRWVAAVISLLVIVGLAYKLTDRRLPAVVKYSSALRCVVYGPYFDEDYQNTFGYPATRWVNANLPEDARVVADARRLGNLDRDWMTIHPTVQCMINIAPEMPADSLRMALQRLGFTHLWVDRLERWKDPTIYPSVPYFMTPWQKLITHDEWLQPVYTDSLVFILRWR